MSNQTTFVQNNFSRSDTILLSIVGAAVIATLIFFISKLITISLIAFFGYDNFDIFDMSNAQMYFFICCISLFILVLMGSVAKIYKKFSYYLAFIFVILSGVLSVIYFSSSGLTLEQYAYQESVSTFEATFLSKRESISDNNHPDLITFYHYKNNPTLDKSERLEYFKVLENDDAILKSLSRYTTVYHMGSFATYFVDPSVMEKFFIAYSDVTDPDLKKLRENMLKYPLVRTTDYIAFHTLYRQQFIAKNALMLKNNKSSIDTQHRRMSDVHEVSHIIHFFENTNAPELNDLKGLFVSLLNQPTVTEVEINQFRSQLTKTLKSNPNIYNLISKL